jgi:hypothetical protein
MNKKMLAMATMAVLVGGSASYAAELSKDVKSAEKEWTDGSVLAHSRMDGNVKKFVDAQKSNALKRKVTLKSDLLGRRGGALKGKGSLNYEVKDADTQKMKVFVHDVKVDKTPLATVSGRYEFNPELNQKVYWLNGTKVSESEYLDQAKKRQKKYDRSKKVSKSFRVANLTASEIEQELASSETKYVSEYQKPVPQVAYGSEAEDAFWNYSRIHNKSEITEYAHNLGFKGQGVGVYYIEGGCVPSQYLDPEKFEQLELPCNNYSTHAIGVLRVLQTTAPQAKLYALQNPGDPGIPWNYDVPILIGSHSWGFDVDFPDYAPGDADMDNYIYENGVVEFVAAGNDRNNPKRPDIVAPPGRAFNAITVGAISPADDMYVSYSTSGNASTRNDKPEVATYTQFRFPEDPWYRLKWDDVYDGKFNGTSAATPFLAGMTADLLSQHHFLWWHPEVVKAVLMASSTRRVNNPDFDIDGTQDFEAGIPLYSNFSSGKDHRWYFWAGENNSNFDSNNEIVLTEENIQQGKRYRIAISWLTSGEFAIQNQRIAQDIDLSVWQNGERIASSATAYNPFELVDFVAPSSDPLTIKIKRYYNLSVSEKVALGYALVRID